LICGLLSCGIGCGSRAPAIDPNQPPEGTRPEKTGLPNNASSEIVIEHTDYHPPKLANDELKDDRLGDKQTAFDPELVDRRPLEGWLVNQSEAVIRLDVPLIKPDREPQLTVLHPSYAAAMGADRESLPSVNLIDGKAKQFDDGLYAAIDLALFQGIADKLPGHLDLIERLLAKVEGRSPAAAYLAAGLTLGGRETKVADDSNRMTFIRRFQDAPERSKPIGFYTWNENLKRCWAFMRFFQKPLSTNDAVIIDLVKVLRADPALAAECQQAARYFAKLTNPLTGLTVSDLAGGNAVIRPPQDVDSRPDGGVAPNDTASLFPSSTSRETELFKRLFPLGVPDGVDLMKELIRRIRSGEVDLTPRENGGWYDHQVYALETLLLPERGEEHHKLLLTKSYKKRMLEAFQALITKRRETHVRQLETPHSLAEPPPELQSVAPRLRVEPCPSFYLRTARSYSFLQTFLMASLGEEVLQQLHGLRKEGERPDDLATELSAQRDLFYGLYLVSCDDIGLSPALRNDEVAEPDRCYDAAIAWLKGVSDRKDPDLAADTRVAVPIYVDPFRKTTRLWVTVGVRLTRLETSYVRPPRIKPANDTGDWKTVAGHMLRDSNYLIAVDEFAEVEIPTLSPPTREELRKLCDAQQTKEKIIAALSAGKW
jgi:hypothetical protein